MKFAILADTHIGRTIPLSVGHYRVKAFSRALTEAIDKIIEEGVDYVFFCGDLFERRTLRPHLVSFVHDELYRLASQTKNRFGKETKILIIRGNHDGSANSDTLDYIRHPLAKYLTVFDEDNTTYNDERLFVVGVGYYDQVDRMYDEIVKPAFAKAEKAPLRILMLHSFIRGHHDVPPNSPSLTIDQLAQLPTDFIFTGHYHKSCGPLRTINGSWLLTPGSLEIYDFGEDSDKGFWIVETKDSSQPQFRRVEIEPMHHMKRVEIKEKGKRPPSWYQSSILREVRNFQAELKKLGKQGYVRIVVSGGLSEGFPSDIDLSEIDKLRGEDPQLLYVDIDTIELELPRLSLSIEHEQIDVADFFKDFGDFASEISEMHVKVRETLEESASVQTGLLAQSQRTPLTEEWLKRFKEHKFAEAGQK